jgi:signal transduction histidine kinase
MQAGSTSRFEDPSVVQVPAPPDAGPAPLSRRLVSHAACLVATLVFFIADVVLPRGATPAIGYCIVPVLARATAGRRFMLVLTGVCTALTWVGFVIEPAGAPGWMSVFERAMVTGVLWLTLLLVWRRMEADAARARQAQSLREAVVELNRSNAELENFASVVSHDIRGPLNSVGLVIQLMSARPPVRSDAECREWANSALSEIARISGMIQRLLSYGHVGAGGVKRSDCDCEAVLAGVRQALRAELEAAGARVTNDPLPTVRADPALIAELFQNLIENGVKYRRPAAPPEIHVRATPEPQGWRFSVRDNGIGIRPEDCRRVFEPFYRGAGAEPSSSSSPSSSPPPPGVGLGLATCKRIIERHGGRIDVRSSPGQGSTFTFVIPDLPAARE